MTKKENERRGFPANGKLSWLIGLIVLIATGVSAHWNAVSRISWNEKKIEIIDQRSKDYTETLGRLSDRLRFVEFVLIRLADKNGIDVNGFK